MRLSTGERIQQGPTLSLAMIVKNEADHLEKCLSTARPHVDEIVVIDTGSTDGTQDIARRYADVFEEIAWPDSFAVARNHSFDRARGDYIMWLDGDEHIPDDAHWQGIRRVLRERDHIAGMELMVRNLVPENQILSADCMYQVRLVKNHPMIRFEGKVHNQIGANLERYHREVGGEMGRAAAEIIHVGYALAPEKINAKYRERLHLLEHEVEHAETAARKAYYQYQLGNAHFMLKNPEAVVEVFDDLDYAQLAPVNAYYTHFMHGFAYLQMGDAPAALQQADALLQLSKDEPIGMVLAGNALKGLGQRNEALLMYIEAYERNEEGRGRIRFALDDAYLLRIIASLCAQLGRWEKAQFFIQQYLESYPDDEKGRRFLAAVNEKLGPSEVPVS